MARSALDELKKAPPSAETIDWARTLLALCREELDESTGRGHDVGVVLKQRLVPGQGAQGAGPVSPGRHARRFRARPARERRGLPRTRRGRERATTRTEARCAHVIDLTHDA
ncbi:hypothetical protein [Nonomuraea dietziae]|uniref:hypothetical protein n=1 Tax=Nonomuraea dietziae TaxID=65515 RepID=UPI0031CDCBF2